METPSGICSRRVNPGSLDCISIELSSFEMVISTTCWRRSARLSPASRKLTTLLVAAFKRIESMPEVMAGKLMPTMSEISATTTIISISVTPDSAPLRSRLSLVSPTDDVGIDPVSAGRSIGAEADDVGLISVITGEVIDVRVTPRIVLDLLLQIGPLPVLNAFGLFTQRRQALFGGGERTCIQLVGPQRRREGIDLSVRRSDLGAVGLVHHLGKHQSGE